MEIMNSAKEAEFTKLTLAGEPLSKKEQRRLQEQSPLPQEQTKEDKSSDWSE